MEIIKNIVESFFSAALFINALLFIPQAIKIYREKNAKDISLLTFSGFLFIQLTIVLHALIKHDFTLFYGYIFSMITCGAVIALALIYKNPSVK